MCCADEGGPCRIPHQNWSDVENFFQLSSLYLITPIVLDKGQRCKGQMIVARRSNWKKCIQKVGQGCALERASTFQSLPLEYSFAINI